MPYHNDDEGDDLDDHDLPEAADMDDDDGPALVPCPYCGGEIAEDAEICPHCKSFISAEDAPPRRRPVWLVVGVVVCLAVVLLAWVLT